MIQQNYLQICTQQNFRSLSKIVLSVHCNRILNERYGNIIINSLIRISGRRERRFLVISLINRHRLK